MEWMHIGQRHLFQGNLISFLNALYARGQSSCSDADARTLTALTATTSVLVYGGLLGFERVVFYPPWIFKFPMPEIWRFFSSFWVTGPQLSVLFDTYFCECFSHARRGCLLIVYSMDIFKGSGERIWTILSAWRFLHLYHLSRGGNFGM